MHKSISYLEQRISWANVNLGVLDLWLEIASHTSYVKEQSIVPKERSHTLWPRSNNPRSSQELMHIHGSTGSSCVTAVWPVVWAHCCMCPYGRETQRDSHPALAPSAIRRMCIRALICCWISTDICISWVIIFRFTLASYFFVSQLLIKREKAWNYTKHSFGITFNNIRTKFFCKLALHWFLWRRSVKITKIGSVPTALVGIYIIIRCQRQRNRPVRGCMRNSKVPKFFMTTSIITFYFNTNIV